MSALGGESLVNSKKATVEVKECLAWKKCGGGGCGGVVKESTAIGRAERDE